MSERIVIFDTTLRDGEQAPGINLNAKAKLEIAEQLARLGVDVIEAGFPVASQGDFEAVREIARTVQGATIAGLSRASLGDVERCFEAVKDAEHSRIHVFLSTSPSHMEHMLRMSSDQVLEATKASVARAGELCDDVEFSPQDATRTPMEFLLQVVQVAVDAGATTLNIPDTVGYAMPWGFADMIRRIREEVPGDYTLSSHCHNDLGLATANSLAAVGAGVRQIEVCVNGIGERAGNASLEEVVMGLRTRRDQFGGLETHVNTEEIVRTSRMVSRLTGYPVQYNKAVVGKNAFAHESGIHQHGVLSDRSTYEIIDAREVGGEAAQIVLGKHSGRHAVADRHPGRRRHRAVADRHGAGRPRGRGHRGVGHRRRHGRRGLRGDRQGGWRGRGARRVQRRRGDRRQRRARRGDRAGRGLLRRGGRHTSNGARRRHRHRGGLGARVSASGEQALPYQVVTSGGAGPGVRGVRVARSGRPELYETKEQVG